MENPPSGTPRYRQWREDFIRRQLQGLAGLGLPQEALAREEALLRGGMAAQHLIPQTIASGAPDE